MLKTLGWHSHLIVLNQVQYIEHTGSDILFHFGSNVITNLEICDHPKVKEIIVELGDDYKLDAINTAYILIAKLLADPKACFLNLTESLFSLTQMSSEVAEDSDSRFKVVNVDKVTEKDMAS